MENCLVTKLKGVVDNDNLSKYNTLQFSVKLSESASQGDKMFYYRYGKIVSVNKAKFDVKTSEGVIIATNVDEYDANNWVNIYLHDGVDYEFEIYPKYNIGGVGVSSAIANCIHMDISQLNYSPITQLIINGDPNIQVENVTGIFKVVEDIALLRLEKCINAGVDIDTLANSTELTNITIGSTKSIGNIENLSGLVGLTQIKMDGCREITGDVEKFASDMAKNRTSGSMMLYGYGSGLYVGDDPINKAIKDNGGTYNIEIAFSSSYPEGYTLIYS